MTLKTLRMFYWHFPWSINKWWHIIWMVRTFSNSHKVFTLASLEAQVMSAIERRYSNISQVSLSCTVHLHEVRCSAGMIISAGQCSDLPEFFKILNCVVTPKDVSFLCKKKKKTVSLVSWTFQVLWNKGKTFSDIHVLDPDMLNDFHPFTVYKVGMKVLVTSKVFLTH